MLLLRIKFAQDTFMESYQNDGPAAASFYNFLESAHYILSLRENVWKSWFRDNFRQHSGLIRANW